MTPKQREIMKHALGAGRGSTGWRNHFVTGPGSDDYADYMRSLGHEEFEVLIGLRADEPARLAKLRADPSGGTRGIERRAPLADLGVSRWDVGRYWQTAPFHRVHRMHRLRCASNVF